MALSRLVPRPAPWRRPLEEEHLQALERAFATQAARNVGLVLGVLLAAVYVGSGYLLHFDPGLYGYAVATLAAAAGLTLRLTAWMMRPAARTLARRYRQLVLRRVTGGAGREVVVRGAGRRPEGARPHPAGFIAAELAHLRRAATPGGSPGFKVGPPGEAGADRPRRAAGPRGGPSGRAGWFPRGLAVALGVAASNLFLNRFIFRRGSWRGWQHALLMWGVIGSFAITVPLVFGWLHFEAVAQDRYRLFAFGLPVVEMPVRGVLSAMVFHALSFFSVLTLVGALMALYRRAWFRDAAVDQRREYDLFPLYLLLAAAVTGLAMSVSHNFFDGVGYPLLSVSHQAAVVFLLLYLPFGKLWHIPMRPLAVGAEVYHEVGSRLETQACARCGRVYASALQIRDVKDILAQTGLAPLAPDGRTHIADYCPECRRVLRGLVYTRRLPWRVAPGAVQPQERAPVLPWVSAPAGPEVDLSPVSARREAGGSGPRTLKEGEHAGHPEP